jgi:hypothetical protein
LSFDPDDDYYADINYYTLWHFKKGQWVSYGKIPTNKPVYFGRSRPFQIKLETAKYGLLPGWHIILAYGRALGTGGTSAIKILRLRHVGQRIPQGQSGYKSPEYLDDNWEILGEATFDDWYLNTAMSGRGFYNPIWGIVYDIPRRRFLDVGSVNNKIYYWDDGFNVIDEGLLTVVSAYTAPMPGTKNNTYSSYYQAFGGTWPYRGIVGLGSTIDNQPWTGYTNVAEYTDPWLIIDSNDAYGWQLIHAGSLGYHQSNFFFTMSPFNIVSGEPPMALKDYMAIVQFSPENVQYKEIGSPDEYPGTTVPIFENHSFDWIWDASCAESNLQIAYVRRKSDGSIWKFRNWNPNGNKYTDFLNLTSKPTNPVSGVEYLNFFMDGPPIPGNETWNTLIILR